MPFTHSIKVIAYFLIKGCTKNQDFSESLTNTVLKDNMGKLMQGQGEKRITLKKHTGFAFSLEDPADIDQIKNRYVM